MCLPDRIPISVNDVGEYVRHRSCDRRFHLRVHFDREVKPLPFFERLLNSVEPILALAGRERENLWERELAADGFTDLAAGLPRDPERNFVEWSVIADRLAALTPGACGYAREVRVSGSVGRFDLAGQIDFLLVRWESGRPCLWLIECKASRRDHTYHRIQVALYRVLLRQSLDGPAVPVGGEIVPADAIACAVARIDETNNANQAILDLPPLDLSAEEADVVRLLGHGGRLDRVTDLALTEIGYRLDEKCDGCMYAVHCLAESARLRRPELLGLDPAAVRRLAAAGLATLDNLANPPVFPTPGMEALSRDPGFDEHLQLLRVRAKARRHTLPGAEAGSEEYDVERVPHSGSGHLPEHAGPAGRLVRVYLTVDYDYTENRVGALSAHVTRSDGRLHTPFAERDGRWTPDPDVCEQVPNGADDRGRPVYRRDGSTRPVRGRDLVEFKAAPWSGTDYAADTAAEGDLIRGFFGRLAGAVADEAGAEVAVPVHFYVWSRAELGRLIEGCGRAGAGLLGHLQELLGCRQGLEQLIYSCVGDEIDRRFALGWTGRGLGVVASLRWFGRQYHWVRSVGGQPVRLDQIFSQLVFDFKAPLGFDGQRWDDDAPGQVFEVRARFADGLPAPYWRAVWGTLPDVTASDNPRLRNEVERFARAGTAESLNAYLAARCHALRWLEENVTPKNPEITKPPLTVAELPDFHLGRDEVAKSALDFLRLDHHVKVSDWVAEHLLPPLARVPLGRTLPLERVAVASDKRTISGRFTLQGFGGLTRADLQARCSFAEGSFVRLSPWNGDPLRGQSVGQLTSAVGRTCVVRSIDWKRGTVVLDAMYAEADGYTVASGASRGAEVLFTDGYATLDESVTDYVARRVDDRLQGAYPVYSWFDPIDPAPPPVALPDPSAVDRYRRLLTSFPLPPVGRFPATIDQVDAVLDGLATRVQLVQGPPGTGKTTTTALALLTRILAGLRPGDLVLVAAHTHRALDELLARIDQYAEAFARHSASNGFAMPTARLVKAHSGEPTLNRVGGGVENLPVSVLKTKKKLTELTTGAVLVLGGTTAGLLKLAAEVGKLRTYNAGAGLSTLLLVVDEASMMVFPHFLALATLVGPDGRVMLTGDHRQLAPITAHDWDREDRPPTVRYQPFASAYDAVMRLAEPPAGGGPAVSLEAVRRSALRYTFRLPPVVRELIARVYRPDRIELTGPDREPKCGAVGGGTVWHEVWRWDCGVFLAVHDEDGSKRSNELELAVVNEILRAAPPLPPGSVAVVTPHRAQRSLLTTRLAVPHGEGQAVDTIDTVERLQGGERPTVIVSATVSDPAAIEANAEFVLDLNRANVAFSRVKDRLVVVCARTLLDHVPSEAEHYRSAVLWKALRALCTHEVGRDEVGGWGVRLLTPPDRRT